MATDEDKITIIALCTLSCAYAAGDDKTAETIKNEYDISPEGSYNHALETSNGIQQEAHGVVKPSKDETFLEVQGSSQYLSPEGETIQLTYIANENGYQPSGSHLPTTPAPQPIPDYILRALEFIKTHPYDEKSAH